MTKTTAVKNNLPLYKWTAKATKENKRKKTPKLVNHLEANRTNKLRYCFKHATNENKVANHEIVHNYPEAILPR